MAKGLKGITVEINGQTTPLIKAISEANTSAKSLQNELKGVNSLLKLDPTNTELAAQKQVILRQAVQETEEKLKLLEQAEREAAAAGKDISDEGYRDLQREIIATKSRLQDLRNEQAAAEASTKKFKDRVAEFIETHPKIKKVADAFGNVKDKVVDAVKNNEKIKQIGTAVEGVKTKIGSLTEKVPLIGKIASAFQKVTPAIAAVRSALPYVEKALVAVGNAAVKAGQVGFKSLQTMIGGTVKAFAAFTATTAAGALAVGKWALGVSQEFDSSMSNVQALMGATAEEMEALSNKAKEMGESTKFTASEAADAFGYMALAGWDAQQSIEGIDGILNLAAAAGMDLAEASDTVTDYLSAFGMEAKQAGEMVDVMAYAQANSNTSAQQLAEAFQNVAANANSMGYDVQQTSALLGVMANQGLKGSKAGTALSAIFRDMTAKAENGAISINGMSIAIQDADGNFRDMADILADVEKATDGMGTAERKAALQSVFTANSISGLNLLLNEGSESISEFTDELYNCAGAAEEQAAIQMDNLSGDITLLKSNVESVALSLGEELTPAMRELTQTANDVVTAFKEDGLKGALEEISEALPELIDQATEFMSEGMAAVGDGITAIVTTLAKTIPTVVNGLLPPLLNSFFGLISSLIDALPQLLPQLLQAAVTFFMGILTGLNSVIPQLAAQIPVLINQITSTLTENLPQIVSAGIDILVNLINGITNAIPSLIEAIIALIPVIVQAIMENLPKIVSAGLNLLIALVTGIVQAIPELVAMLPTIIVTIVDTLLSMLPEIIQAGIELLNSLISGIIQAIPQLIASLPQIISSIVNTLIKHLPQIISAGIELIGALISGLIQAIPTLIAAIPQIVTAIFTTFKNVNWAELGKNIIDGVINGVKNAASSLINVFKDLASSALDAVKSFFGIASPSKVMRDQVGKMLPAGMAVGVEEGMDDEEERIRKAMEKGVPTTIDSYVNVKAGSRAAETQSAAGGFTQNLTINSPRELSPSETARQTRNATRQMVLKLKPT